MSEGTPDQMQPTGRPNTAVIKETDFEGDLKFS